MKKNRLLLLLLLIGCTHLSAQSLKLNDLKCEFYYDDQNRGLTTPVFSWKLQSSKRDVLQTAYQIRVATDIRHLKSGKNLIWDTGKVNSEQSIYVPYQGSPLESRTNYYWQVTVWDNKGNSSKGEIREWSGGLTETDWQAQWIQTAGNDKEKQVVLFRKLFNIEKPVKTAHLYITSQGLYEAELNGSKVGDQLFTPGWTTYKKRIQYQAYEVSRQIVKGENALLVSVAEGWYKGPLMSHLIYGDKVALLSQLEIEYEDGSKEKVVSDPTWKTYTDGPVVQSGIYFGEIYDARKKDRFSTTFYKENSSWSPAVLSDHQSYKELVASVGPPVSRQEIIKPKEIITTPLGEKVINFGQNLTGRIRFTVKGAKGDSILISHAEVLDREGNFYTANLRHAKQQLIYFLNGDEHESYEPVFTFQGFQYIRIEGNKELINMDNIEAVVIHSNMQHTGKFTTSNELLNQLQHNILWGQKSNFLDVPTDCPQRDERLGWTGDAQVFFKTATFNMDVSSFFVKWMADLRADQLENGGVPGIIPNIWEPNRNETGTAGWADAATIIPWEYYRVYGDKQMLETSYHSMIQWAAYIESKSTDHLWDQSWHHGDWLHYMPINVWDKAPAYTDKTLLAQAFYAYTLQLIIKTAKVLDKKEDEIKYSRLLQLVKDKFVTEFVTPAGGMMSNTQTAYVLALQFDILPEEKRPEAARRLVKLIEEYGYHISTGFLGTPHICHVLSRFGYQDVAYKLLLQENFPSWIYPVKKGATTIWERWDGIKPDGTFQDVAMNSFNHYAYGAIGEWMYRNIGGLGQEEGSAGFKNILISPQPGGDITSSQIEYNSVYGLISCSWKIEDKKMRMDVQIPPNTTARIIFPGLNGEVTESGKTIPTTNNSCQVGSGKYSFSFDIR